MPRMNLKKGLRANIESALMMLPTPVAKFVAQRVMVPITLMVVALLMAVTFAVFMAIVIIMAPFSPESAGRIFHHIVDGMDE